MKTNESLSKFLKGIRDDGRIGPTHISLFLAILQYAEERQLQDPICVFSKELMELAKISGAGTYYKNIWQLHEYGYIHYIISYNHFLGSLIYFDM
jgi:hypothetical protein